MMVDKPVQTRFYAILLVRFWSIVTGIAHKIFDKLICQKYICTEIYFFLSLEVKFFNGLLKKKHYPQVSSENSVVAYNVIAFYSVFPIQSSTKLNSVNMYSVFPLFFF